jgi:hypothetical protein
MAALLSRSGTYQVKHSELFDPQRLAAEEIIRGGHFA